MGNSFSTPESMKHLPNSLNKDEYIKIKKIKNGFVKIKLP